MGSSRCVKETPKIVWNTAVTGKAECVHARERVREHVRATMGGLKSFGMGRGDGKVLRRQARRQEREAKV